MQPKLENELLLAMTKDEPGVIAAYFEMFDVSDARLSLKCIEIPPILKNHPPLIAVGIYLGAQRCVEFMASYKTNLRITDECGRVAVHFAAACGELEILEMLERNNACLTSLDAKKRNILHYAAQFGHLNIVKWITAKKLKLNEGDEMGYTPLHFAAEGGKEDIVQTLLDSGMEQTRSINGWTPILFAAKNNRTECFQALVRKGGDISEANEQGEVAIHWACFNGNFPILRLCLSKGASPNALTKKHETPLIFAAMSNHVEILEFLLVNGADPSIQGSGVSFLFIQFHIFFLECSSLCSELWECSGYTGSGQN